MHFLHLGILSSHCSGWLVDDREELKASKPAYLDFANLAITTSLPRLSVGSDFTIDSFPRGGRAVGHNSVRGNINS